MHAKTQLPEFLKATEVAALLRVNRNTIYEAVQRDEIPGVVRIGRVLRFRRDAIVAWIDDRQRVPLCAARS